MLLQNAARVPAPDTPDELVELTAMGNKNSTDRILHPPLVRSQRLEPLPDVRHNEFRRS